MADIRLYNTAREVPRVPYMSMTSDPIFFDFFIPRLEYSDQLDQPRENTSESIYSTPKLRVIDDGESSVQNFFHNEVEDHILLSLGTQATE